jgi:hypothetical protein
MTKIKDIATLENQNGTNGDILSLSGYGMNSLTLK